MLNTPDKHVARSTLRPEEVEAVYGISASQLQKHRMRRDGPAYSKPSHRMVLYRPIDIEAWLDSFRVRSTSEAR